MDGSRTLGVDIGGTNIKIASLRHDGTVLRSLQIPTEVESGPAAALQRIELVLRDLMQREGMRTAELGALGVASAGIIDPVHNLVLDSPNLRNWERFPLAALLAERLGVPVFLENDVNAMAYAEWRCGAGRGTQHLVCLTLGTGVGGGLILDGRLYRGTRGAAGELGHMCIDVHGPRCSCPSRGCLERNIGAFAIVERAEAKLAGGRPSQLRDQELSPQVISEAAEAGDAVAAEVLRETGELLGMGLVNLANIFNPERFVVGGGVALAGDRLLEPARQTLRRHAMSLPAQTVDVVVAELGNDAQLVGAALLALERVTE